MEENGSEEKRKFLRLPIRVRVDYWSEETFLFEYSSNVSREGIFIQTTNPLPPSTRLRLQFSLPNVNYPFEVEGEVIWVNPYRPGEENINPGMGIQFLNLKDKSKELINHLVRRKAYLFDDQTSESNNDQGEEHREHK